MKTECSAVDPRAWAVALARWVLGVMLLFYGIGKLPDVSGFASHLVTTFAKTWLPEWLTNGFGHTLPYIEVVLGALLILGLMRNVVLFLTGLYFLVLTFGQVVLQQPGVVFNNISFTIFTAGVLFLAEYDCWAFPRRQKRVEPAPTAVPQ